MAEKFLNCTDVVAVFKKMCCKGMAKCMAASTLGDSGFTDSVENCTLHETFIKIIPPFPFLMMISFCPKSMSCMRRTMASETLIPVPYMSFAIRSSS